jgi:hypothetical protein
VDEEGLFVDGEDEEVIRAGFAEGFEVGAGYARVEEDFEGVVVGAERGSGDGGGASGEGEGSAQGSGGRLGEGWERSAEGQPGSAGHQ